MRVRRWLVIGFVVCGFVVRAGAPVAAAEFKPSGPVTIVAPFAAGGTVDQVARELGHGLEKLWGVPVLIDNKPGAGNILAATAVAQSKPDGQKLLLATT
jgi:tripartite-type tricarboxylate transporter receptor subunit TctC